MQIKLYLQDTGNLAGKLRNARILKMWSARTIWSANVRPEWFWMRTVRDVWWLRQRSKTNAWSRCNAWRHSRTLCASTRRASAKRIIITNRTWLGVLPTEVLVDSLCHNTSQRDKQLRVEKIKYTYIIDTKESFTLFYSSRWWLRKWLRVLSGRGLREDEWFVDQICNVQG